MKMRIITTLGKLFFSKTLNLPRMIKNSFYKMIKMKIEIKKGKMKLFKTEMALSEPTSSNSTQGTSLNKTTFRAMGKIKTLITL